jgi:hypothetical protein
MLGDAKRFVARKRGDGKEYELVVIATWRARPAARFHLAGTWRPRGVKEALKTTLDTAAMLLRPRTAGPDVLHRHEGATAEKQQP